MRILVVEDDFLIRQIAVSLLKRLGCEVFTASNGVEALTHFSSSWDLIFMDCQMPLLDGLATCRRWRDLEEKHNLRHVPIVALSAESNAEEIQRCIQAGMDGFVSKPLDLEKLRTVLEQNRTGQSYEQPHKADSGSPPPFNTSSLLNEYVGFESLLHQLATFYLTDWPKTVELLQQLQNSDFEGIAALTHKFKGQAMTMHFHSLAQLIEELEILARQKNTVDATAIVTSWKGEFEQAVQSLENIVDRTAPFVHTNK